MTKMLSAMKKEKAQKRHDAKTENNRVLAEALTKKLFSDERKPEKGVVKSMMKNLTEHGELEWGLA